MKQPELTFEEFCQLPLQYCMGLVGDDGARRLYRNDAVGLQMEIITKRKRWGDIYSGWKPGQRYFFLDRDPSEYRTLDQVYVAYMAKVCGVSHEQ